MFEGVCMNKHNFVTIYAKCARYALFILPSC